MNTTTRAGTRPVMTLAILCGLLTAGGFSSAQPQARGADAPVRIGAVAYSPSVVTIFKGLTAYLNKREFPCEYVLYSSYDALVGALEKGEVQIAWNTPLAHGRFHVRNQCRSQTLVMRDVDVNVRSVLVARSDSGIRSLDDLANKRLILGSSEAAEATVLPLHFLKTQGVSADKCQLISLEGEVDSKGNPCASPRHVLAALREGRGDAGIITAGLWQRLQANPEQHASLVKVWTSPAFSHCVFTAAAGFDPDLAARFTELMVAMDPASPETAEVMRLEGTRRWLPSSPKGFESLVEALQETP